MFQFSAFASPSLWIQLVMTALVAPPGFPIQISPGHSSFGNSPELIAAYYVFHRLSAPRHPPCALYSLIIHPTPSGPTSPKRLWVAESLDSSTKALDVLIGFLNPIAHLSLYRFLLFCCQSPSGCHPSRRRGGLIRAWGSVVK